MNELSKLFSSVLLLAAGFAAASLFSPPEVIDRLANLVRPSAPAGATLQPLPANAPPLDAQGWPELPAAQPPQPATQQASDSVWGAPVAPSVRRAAWPGPADLSETPAEPPLDLESPRRALKPIPRATGEPAGAAPLAQADTVQADPAPADAVATEPADWSAFAAPSTLDNSPYANRPEQATAPVATGFPELGAPTPLARQPERADYTSHIVTDGDTLESLAERYLGDPARAEELFEINNDRLTRPDLLPIGMVLRTPKERRRVAPAAPRGAATIDPAGSMNAFSTISSAGDPPFAPRGDSARPLTPIHRGEAPLSSAASEGPVDPWYAREVMWDANQW